jgi:peptide/nickel transport system substrate-binding protein
LIHDAYRRVRDNVYTIPQHRQVIPWAVRKGVDVVHRADNVLESAWVRIE